MPALESSLEAIAKRVAKLEAQNRRLKKVGIAALLVVTAIMTLGQARPVDVIADHIKARSIDADLIQIGDGKENGSTTLLLSGRILVKMGRNRLVSLSAREEDGPNVVVTDEAGYSANLGKSDLLSAKTGRVEKTSAASLVLLGKDNKVLWSAP